MLKSRFCSTADTLVYPYRRGAILARQNRDGRVPADGAALKILEEVGERDPIPAVHQIMTGAGRLLDAEMVQNALHAWDSRPLEALLI
jgi:hypothetical protein